MSASVDHAGAAGENRSSRPSSRTRLLDPPLEFCVARGFFACRGEWTFVVRRFKVALNYVERFWDDKGYSSSLLNIILLYEIILYNWEFD